MSSCMRYQQQISQMLDGELPGRADADTARTSAHLPRLPACL